MMVVSPKRILWPTDFSELSLQGARYARGFRDVFGAALHIVHVIRPMWSPDVGVTVPLDVPTSLSEPELIQSCRKGLQQLVDQHFEGDESIVYDTFVGNPWHGVCEYAQTNDIDLIVVATHGHTGLRHVLIGGTAERIVQHAPCPVLTVKSPEKEFVIE